MSRVREVPLYLTRPEAAEVYRALQVADRQAVADLEQIASTSWSTPGLYARRDVTEQRRLRLAAVLDKLERAIGVPLAELSL